MLKELERSSKYRLLMSSLGSGFKGIRRFVKVMADQIKRATIE
jgi:hypothetical protein